MNTELKLQALLDGELDAREAREVEGLLANDIQAAALMQELKWTKAAAVGNEVAVALPETREFYWGKISRAIAVEERKAAATASPERAWWLKFLYPVTGLAATVAVMFAISGGRTTDDHHSSRHAGGGERGARRASGYPHDLDASSHRSGRLPRPCLESGGCVHLNGVW